MVKYDEWLKRWILGCLILVYPFLLGGEGWALFGLVISGEFMFAGVLTWAVCQAVAAGDARRNRQSG